MYKTKRNINLFYISILIFLICIIVLKERVVGDDTIHTYKVYLTVAKTLMLIYDFLIFQLESK